MASSSGRAQAPPAHRKLLPRQLVRHHLRPTRQTETAIPVLVAGRIHQLDDTQVNERLRGDTDIRVLVPRPAATAATGCTAGSTISSQRWRLASGAASWSCTRSEPCSRCYPALVGRTARWAVRRSAGRRAVGASRRRLTQRCDRVTPAPPAPSHPAIPPTCMEAFIGRLGLGGGLTQNERGLPAAAV